MSTMTTNFCGPASYPPRQSVLGKNTTAIPGKKSQGCLRVRRCSKCHGSGRIGVRVLLVQHRVSLPGLLIEQLYSFRHDGRLKGGSMPRSETPGFSSKIRLLRVTQTRSQYLHPGGYRPSKVIQSNTIRMTSLI